VHPAKLLSNAKLEARFLRRLRDKVIPPMTRPIIVTDAGFKNPWFRAVRRLGWDFVGRLNVTVMLSKKTASEKGESSGRKWTKARTLFAKATTRAKDLGQRTITVTNPLDARVVVVAQRSKGRKGSKKVSRKGIHPGCCAYKKYRRRNQEPWLLATSLDGEDASWIVGTYATRMQIEETFRDAKNHRFGWSFEDARSTRAERLEVLLLLASLGLLALMLVAAAAEAEGRHLGYQANTVRSHRVLSLFMLGKVIVQRQEDNLIERRRLTLALKAVQRTVATHPLSDSRTTS
jgi:hypothetical protein